MVFFTTQLKNITQIRSFAQGLRCKQNRFELPPSRPRHFKAAEKKMSNLPRQAIPWPPTRAAGQRNVSLRNMSMRHCRKSASQSIFAQKNGEVNMLEEELAYWKTKKHPTQHHIKITCIFLSKKDMCFNWCLRHTVISLNLKFDHPCAKERIHWIISIDIVSFKLKSWNVYDII